MLIDVTDNSDNPSAGSNETIDAAPASAAAVTGYINRTTALPEALSAAHQDAEEFGITAPDALTGEFLTGLMQLASGQHTSPEAQAASAASTPVHAAAVAATPAAGVVGLHLLAGMPHGGQLTCIDAEVEHQSIARAAFRRAGIPATRHRFLPSRPRDVLGRLAPKAYDLIYVDVNPSEAQAIQQLAWPLLRTGGLLIFAGLMLDGTVADQSRTDNETQAARAAEETFAALADGADGSPAARVMRLPIQGGTTVLMKLG